MKALFLFLFLIGSLQAEISSQDLQKIGEKIWETECLKKDCYLVFWMQGEESASLGIGHFIWYSENGGPFDAQFPKLLSFLQEKGVTLPSWLENIPPCPWNSKEEFDKHLEDPEMVELRFFLKKTIPYQVLFIKKRLDESLPKMVQALSSEKKELVTKHFKDLSETSQGTYALMDYVNFKGEGIAPKEEFKGVRWGLLQVLLEMKEEKPPLQEFVHAAKKVLTRRVEVSPRKEVEQKWLKGWLNRVDSYLVPLLEEF